MNPHQIRRPWAASWFAAALYSTLISTLMSTLSLAPAAAQSAAAEAARPIEAVTVVVEVTLTPNSTPTEALSALSGMRAMMKAQPGYLSEQLLENLNASNAPRYVHMSRWVNMSYWAAVFRAPEFGRLNAHGNEHYSVSVSAFQPVD